MFVAGLGNSAGRRADQRRATAGVKAARGGRRTKMTQEEQNAKLKKWRHPDLSGVKAQAIQESKDRHNSGSDV